MPNTPLQTFRTVEPANYGFGSSATMASRPFVLYHSRGTPVVTQTAANGTLGYPAFTGSLAPTRFQPWTVRDQNNHYPVKIPNAYDRVFVFPMFVIDTVNGVTGNTGSTTEVVTDTSVATPPTSYTAPLIMPFGRFPESTYNPDTVNPQHSRSPWDLIKNLNRSFTLIPDPQTTGIWTALPPYATNFTTSNGQVVAVPSASNPVSTPRGTSSGVGIGNAYQLPPDMSLGFQSTNNTAASNTASVFAAGGSQVWSGAGIEFSTMGCEELVVSLIAAPTNLPAVTLGAQPTTGTGAAQGAAAINFFLMGVFLG
jgi:hypothetical protein